MFRILVNTLIIVLFSFNSTFSQKGYFADDTLRTIGVNIIDGGNILNSKICRVKIRDTIVSFTPYEIIEYGISKEKIYQAKDVFINDSNKRVFLEILVKGDATLYYYQDENYETFFFGKDSVTLIEIPRKKDNDKSYYKSVLRDITSDCSGVNDAINLVKYRREPVSLLINRFNDCGDKPFPFFKFGIFGGYEFSKLAKSSLINPTLLEHFDYHSDGFFTVGLFADFPVMPTNFSLHIELYHSSHKFSETGTVGNEVYDLTANQNAVKMPVLLRYSLNKRKTIPFINAGGIAGFNYRAENAIYITNSKNNKITIDKLENISVISQFQYGFSAGMGIEQKINYKNALFFELRLNKLFGQSKNTLANNELLLITGINF